MKPSPSSLDPLQETSGRFDRRNFIINITEGALWVSGASLLSAQTVLPAFITNLGAGNFEVGLLGVVLWVGLFLPQIISARYSQRFVRKKPWAIGFGLAQRIAVLSIAVFTFVLNPSPPYHMLWYFFILYTLNQVLLGLSTPVWFDMYAKLTPVRVRGRFTGIRNSVAGIGSFACGVLLTYLLDRGGFPFGYAIAFGVAFSLQFISIVLQFWLVEEYPSRIVEAQTFSAFLHGLPAVLRSDRNYSRFLAGSAFLILGTMPLGFFTVYAIRELNATAGTIGEFTLIMVLGQMVGAILIGIIADRIGNKHALLSAGAAMLCASGLALVLPSLSLYKAVFFFVGINLGSELMTRFNFALECSPVEQRPIYIGLMNTILAPLYLSGFAAGWISEIFGYRTLFAISALISVMALVVLMLSVHDPRSTEIPRQELSRG